MTTEILGFLIIVGAIIVVIARRQMQQAENDTEVIEASAGRLRYELEQSADEIISRMAGHIDHLETLLREADYKADLLERRMDEFKQLQMDVQAQRQINIGENVAQLTGNRDLENLPGGDEHDDFAQADLYGGENDGYEDITQPEAENKMSEMQLKALEAIREASMALEAAQNELGVYDNDTDEAELHSNEKAIQQTPQDDEDTFWPDDEPVTDKFPEEEPYIEVAEPTVIATKPEPDTISPERVVGVNEEEAIQKYISRATGNVAGGEELSAEEATIIARKLLEAGFEPEEVGKLTGLGMEAVRLLQPVRK